MSDLPDLRNDERLMAAIADALQPNELNTDDRGAAAIGAVFTFRRMDAELAELVHDSALSSSSGTRDGGDERTLSYSTDAISIDLTLASDGHTVVGSVAPQQASAALETPDGLLPLALDDLGRFLAETIARQFRLVTTSHDGVEIVTPWVFR